MRFDRIGLSMNFANYGRPGASLIFTYTQGRNAVTDLGAPLLDEQEVAITADFRPPDGPLQGLWLRIRFADADRGAPMNDRRDVRIILNYNFGESRQQ